MFLAFREIRHARLRFALITAVIVMVSSLVFILSGLANGLATGNSAAIDALPIDGMLLSAGSDNQLDRSRLATDVVEDVRGQEGVEDAQPFGATASNVTVEGSDEVIGVSIIGVNPDSFAAPSPSEGDALGGEDNAVVIDRTLADEGVEIGDTLLSNPGEVELRVVGIVEDRSYRLAPTLFMPIELWQEVQAEGSDQNADTINGVLVQGEADAIAALPDFIDNTVLASKQEVIESLPGYSEQALTLLLIQVFLVIIAAGIVASFFYIITLQKIPELGVMKALGTKTAYIARNLITQVVVLGLVGVVLGIVIAWAMAFAVGSAVPYTLDFTTILLFGGILLVVAILGTVLSLLQVAKIDPLDAINKAG
jgi:putative ABC transport system permease protein